ncbi:hypothetical protein ACFQ7F_45645 [Streptomyces sp. NPDC056486]|uniref:hypothetical protein n=1 Tax=Streptomyces sp. NPDC056486 TaxID=3345835 RepID=UPI0036CEFBD6
MELFFNATGTAFFRAPAGAKINVKYGKGRLSVNRQVQVLNGEVVKKLSVGKGSILGARMRVKVASSADVTYDVYPGNVAIQFPEQNF